MDVFISCFLPQTFEMYVARADCSPNNGSKDSFVLKEGQFVEVLDSVHPDRWLVRTKPTKTNPARQGWLCPAYLEKKRKVGCINSDGHLNTEKILYIMQFIYLFIYLYHQWEQCIKGEKAIINYMTVILIRRSSHKWEHLKRILMELGLQEKNTGKLWGSVSSWVITVGLLCIICALIPHNTWIMWLLQSDFMFKKQISFMKRW